MAQYILFVKFSRIKSHEDAFRVCQAVICETADWQILFSYDEGLVPTDLLVNTFPFFLSSYT